MAYSSIIDDSTDAVIQRMIEAMREFIREEKEDNNGNDNRRSRSLKN
jgi:hypothetical protein